MPMWIWFDIRRGNKQILPISPWINNIQTILYYLETQIRLRHPTVFFLNSSLTFTRNQCNTKRMVSMLTTIAFKWSVSSAENNIQHISSHILTTIYHQYALNDCHIPLPGKCISIFYYSTVVHCICLSQFFNWNLLQDTHKKDLLLTRK